MLRKIKVYGQLAKFLKRRVFEAEVSTAAEAVRFLLANFPHLESHMAHRYYKISVGKADLGLDELHCPAGRQEIRIIPVMSGAGSTGEAIGQIFLGVAIVAAVALIPGAAAWLGPTAATLLTGIGASLALGGVAQLLTPVPQIIAPGASATNTEKDPRKSYSFSGIQNTSRQGVPVPIVYGETIVGSVVISAGVDTVQVTG